MALNVVLVTQRQSPKGMCLIWSPMEDVASYVVLVASRKLAAEELEAAVALGGTDDCIVAKLAPTATSVVDDLSAAGDVRFYGVAMNFKDGDPRPARFRAISDGATPESILLSVATGKAAPKPAAPTAPRPAAASPTGNTGAFRIATPGAAPTGNTGQARVAAPGASPTGNTGAYRVAAPGAAPTGNTGQTRVAAPAAAAAASPSGNTGSMRVGTPAATAPVAAAAAPPAEDPMEARKRQQAAARARRDAEAAAEPTEQVAPPSQIPLEEPFAFRMSGGTQTWDGLRITWERVTGAAAYEILVSDHQIFGDELADALAGKADFTSATAVGPSTTALIDNITPREARGWYLVLARAKDGTRTPHPFQVGDAEASGRAVAAFVNPNRTGELRAEVEGMLADAREQLERWTSEKDTGAQREAKRLVRDALLIFPNHPGAKALAEELG